MEKFKQVETLEQFLDLWSEFYLNKICIPSYYATFVGSPDNPRATFELGKKLIDITKIGVIPYDSQLTISGYQKGYIMAYIPEIIAESLSEELNRHDNIIAFTTDLHYNGVDNLFVTYNINDENKLKGVTKISADVDTLEYYHCSIHSWISDGKLKQILNHHNYVSLTLVNPSFSSHTEYVYDVLLSSINNIKAVII